MLRAFILDGYFDTQLYPFSGCGLFLIVIPWHCFFRINVGFENIHSTVAEALKWLRSFCFFVFSHISIVLTFKYMDGLENKKMQLPSKTCEMEV